MMYRVPGDISGGAGRRGPGAAGPADPRPNAVRRLLRADRHATGIPNWTSTLRSTSSALPRSSTGIEGRVACAAHRRATRRPEERAEALPRLAALAREAMEKCRRQLS
jgi:hypothetical protein